MKQFQLITDACCDLPGSYLKEHEVDFIPMTVNIDGDEYVDDLGETFDYAWFVEQIQQGAMPTTSQINIGTYLEIFEHYATATEPVLYLCFSSGLSGSYNNAQSALQLVKETYPEIPLTIVDSKAASLGEGLLVMELIKRRDAGATLAEALAWVEDMKMKLHSWVTVADLQHLQRGGRISKTAATMGGLMNIQPIIVMNKEGKLINQGKVRGRKKSFEKIVDEVVQGIVEPAEQTIIVAYAGDKQAGETIQQLLAAKLTVQAIEVRPMGPTIFSHTGYGALAIFSFGRERTS